MFESILAISIAGFLAGFIFSMPIAGPVSILITTNALKGRFRYCSQVSLGASIADFIYVFVAVYGVTRLYALFMPLISYFFTAASLFFFYLAYKIIITKIDIEHLENKSHFAERIERREKSAFYTGFMINFLNPTLFIGVLTSSFFVISIVSSMGFNTGGLAGRLDQNVKEVSVIEGVTIDKPNVISIDKFENIKIGRKEHLPDLTVYSSSFHLIISICYAIFLSLGSVLWFNLMSYMVVSFRKRINLTVISVFIKSLGAILGLFGLYFGYQAFKAFLAMRS